jgi:hypothetical protein
LRGINNADWELVHRLFQCVAVASRPFRVEELAEFLAFDLKIGPIAKFHEGWRLEDPMDVVLSTCSTLLSVVTIDGSAVIQFSHLSVREFLTSSRLSNANDETLRRYHISMTPAHTIVAQACLGILLHLDTTITRDKLENYPLAKYAAQHWIDHARFEGVYQYTEKGVKQLLDPRKPHLAIWTSIYDPRNPLMNSERAERQSAPGGTPLHYAAFCGLPGPVKFLVVTHPRDVHSRGFDNKSTPLHEASTFGHVEVVRILIGHGADVTARDNDGKTPLHLASIHENVEVARFLIKHGADATAQANNGWTPLHVASSCGCVEVARVLVEHGADVTAQGNDGRTPFYLALAYGHVEVAQFLVDLDSDTTARPTRLYHYFFTFCFFIVEIYLHVM